MHYFLLECKRMYTSKRFVFALIMVAFCLFCGAYDMFEPYYDMVDAMTFSVKANTTAILAWLWVILGSIPWAITVFEERDSGYRKCLQLKAGAKTYYISKYCTNMLAAFSIIIIPTSILNIAFAVSKGTSVLEDTIKGLDYAPSLALSHPILYNFIVVGNIALATVVYSGFCMAASVYIKNKFIAVVIPFVIYIVSSLSFNYTNLCWLSGQYLYDINELDVHYGARAIVSVVMIVICFFIFVWGNLNEEENQRILI